MPKRREPLTSVQLEPHMPYFCRTHLYLGHGPAPDLTDMIGDKAIDEVLGLPWGSPPSSPPHMLLITPEWNSAFPASSNAVVSCYYRSYNQLKEARKIYCHDFSWRHSPLEACAFTLRKMQFWALHLECEKISIIKRAGEKKRSVPFVWKGAMKQPRISLQGRKTLLMNELQGNSYVSGKFATTNRGSNELTWCLVGEKASSSIQLRPRAYYTVRQRNKLVVIDTQTRWR